MADFCIGSMPPAKKASTVPWFQGCNLQRIFGLCHASGEIETSAAVFKLDVLEATANLGQTKTFGITHSNRASDSVPSSAT